MPTYATNVLPANTGLALGASNQKWNAYIQNLFGDTFQSNTLNPALSGVIRLASVDGIAWRNNANAADVTLSKTGAAAGNVPADTLVFSGGGIEGPFISQTGNPAATGILRLASADAVAFRNNGNTGDISGLSHNSDDTVTAGGTAGIKQSIISSATANVASAGVIRLANVSDAINWRNAANSADEGLSVDSGDRLVNSAAGGLVLTGATPNIRMGGTTAGFPMLKRNFTAIQARLADDSADAAFSCGNLTVNGNVTSYGGTATAGIGAAVIRALASQSGQNAAITTVTLLTPAAPAYYRLNYYLYVSTAGNAVNLTGTFGWTDSAAHTLTTANIACNTLGANSTSAVGLGSIVLFSAAAQPITYATALSGGIGIGFYTVTVVLEQIG